MPFVVVSQKICLQNTVSNEFSTFFTNIGKNTIEKISTLAEQVKCGAHDRTFAPRDYPTFEQFFFDASVNTNQVQKIIKSMASNKSPGLDKIPFRVIKDCLPACHQSHPLLTLPSILLNFLLLGKLRK